MLKILHGAAALVLAVLLELLAGDFALVLPLSGCVLHRITEKADYCVIFVSGFGVGLLFDLLYWRTFPVTALVFGLGLTAARWLCRRLALENRFAAALAGGLLVGLFTVVPLTVVNTLRSGFRTIPAGTVLAGIAGAALFQLLICPGSGKASGAGEPALNVPKRPAPRQKQLRRPRGGKKE